MALHRQGRPQGRRKVPFPLRLYPEQLRDLRILHEILDGEPSVNGLIVSAVARYLTQKLKNPRVRTAYEARVPSPLKVVS